MESKPLLDPMAENHGVQMWAGIRKVPSPASSTISRRLRDVMPRMGLPSERMLPTAASDVEIFFAAAMSGAPMTWCTLRTLSPCL